MDDEAPKRGAVRYRVRAVSVGGEGPASDPITVEPAKACTAGLGAWLDGPIGEAEGRSALDGGTITFTAIAADGFARGDDAVLQQRYHEDSLYAATRLVDAEGQVSARLGGAASGVIVRDSTAGRARYVYFGANGDGQLELRTRSLDTRSDIGTSRPGVPGGEYGPTRSPAVAAIDALSIEDRPYVRLQRAGHVFTASASADGSEWQTVASVTVPMVEIVHAGVASTAGPAVFRDVRLD
jgi:hypothetical protein